jgi:VanZ family protein
MALNSTRITWLLQLQRFMPYVFFAGLALTTVLLLIPSYNIPKAFDFYDKAQHVLVFVTLTVAGLLAFPNVPKHSKAVVLGLICYGGLMEVLQSALTTTRHGEWLDWLTDGVGILVGVGVYLASRKFAKFTINKIAT